MPMIVYTDIIEHYSLRLYAREILSSDNRMNVVQQYNV